MLRRTNSLDMSAPAAFFLLDVRGFDTEEVVRWIYGSFDAPYFRVSDSGAQILAGVSPDRADSFRHLLLAAPDQIPFSNIPALRAWDILSWCEW